MTPWTVAHQAPLSVEFSRQEYWSGLPFHPPGDLLHPGIESTSPGGFFFTTEPSLQLPDKHLLGSGDLGANVADTVPASSVDTRHSSGK